MHSIQQAVSDKDDDDLHDYHADDVYDDSMCDHDVVDDDDLHYDDNGEEFLSNVHNSIAHWGKILFIRFRVGRFLNPESQICLL